MAASPAPSAAVAVGGAVGGPAGLPPRSWAGPVPGPRSLGGGSLPWPPAGVGPAGELPGCAEPAGRWRRPGCPAPRTGAASWSTSRRVGVVEPQCLVDHRPAGQLVPVDERDGDAGFACAAGAADAVHVGLLVLGDLVVDDVRDVVDVDAAGGDVGGDQPSCRRCGSLSAFSRATWPRSPCTAPTLNPRSASSSETFWAVRFVRVKTIVAPRPSACRIAADHLDLVQRVRTVGELLGGVVWPRNGAPRPGCAWAGS